MFPACLLYSARYAVLRLICKTALVLLIAAGPVFADPIRLVAFGDSLTHGFGLAQGDGFVPQLQRWLKARGRDVTVINMGVSGDTTEGGRARLAWALAGGADALILELGGNDLLRGVDPARSRANLDAMLGELGRRKVPVLLAGLEAPLNYGPDYKAAFDGMFADLARAHGTLLYPSFMKGIVRQGGLMQRDGVHPNAKGVGVIVNGIGPLVLKLLDRARK